MYGYIGSMRALPGKRDEVIDLLLKGLDSLPAAGCCDTDADRIWVTEVWESAEHHVASLQLPKTQAAIAAAMPLLTGEFTRQESQVVGRLGLGGGRWWATVGNRVRPARETSRSLRRHRSRT